jgi:hypothetical protein
VPPGEFATSIVDVDTACGRDPLGAPLVILDVAAERLLGAEPLDLALQLRPTRETVLLCELELRLAELDAFRAGAFFRLLAQLLETEVKPTASSSPSCPSSAGTGGKKLPGRCRSPGWARPFPRTDAACTALSPILDPASAPRRDPAGRSCRIVVGRAQLIRGVAVQPRAAFRPSQR